MIDTPVTRLGKYTIVDPYPLITDDGELWLKLLFNAHKKNRYLFGILMWIRTVGARLEKTGNKDMPYKIVPIIATEDMREGWQSNAEWEQEKQNLVPFINDLVEVIKLL